MMRRLATVLALLMAAVLISSGLLAAAPRDSLEPLDKRSGFYDFATFAETIPSGSGGPGRGTIPGTPCVQTTASQPAEFSGNFLMNCDSVGPHNETTIAINPLNPANVIGGSHSYQLELVGNTINFHIIAAAYATTNGGQTWTNVHPPLGSWQFTGDPVLFFDAAGRAYYVNIADHEGQGGPFTNVSVIAQRSDDSGLTWTDPVTVAPGRGAIAGGPLGNVIFNDKPWATADTNANTAKANYVYVTYTRFLFQHNSYIESPIYFSRSTNGGVTWSAPKEISGSSATLCTQQIDSTGGANRCDENQFSQPVVAPDGTIYVSFLNEQHPASTNFRDQVLVVKSTDGGVTWSAPVAATTILNDGVGDFPTNTDGRQSLVGCRYRVHVAGALAADPTNSQRLYYVFVNNTVPSSTTTQTDVFVVRSDNGGANWSAPITVNTSAKDQIYPWAAVDNNGMLRVGYMDHDRPPVAGQTCVFGYSLSTATSSPATAFSHQAVETGLSIASNSRWFGINTRFLGDYTNVAVGADGSVWSTWTDLRQDTTFLGITRKDQDAVSDKIP